MCVNRFSYPNHEEVTIAEPHYDRPSTHYPLPFYLYRIPHPRITPIQFASPSFPHSVQYALPSSPLRVRKEEEDTAQATYNNKAPHSTRIPSVPRTYCL